LHTINRWKLLKASKQLAVSTQAAFGKLNVVVKQVGQLVLVGVVIKDSDSKVCYSRMTREIVVPALPKTTARNVWKAISLLLDDVY